VTRYTITIVALISMTAFLASCGGGDGNVLASGEGITVTVDDFRAEFETLTPEGQVRVLEPGGRMDLVMLMVNRQLLLTEAAASPPDGLQEWLDVSEKAYLSHLWLIAEFDSMNTQGMDSIWIDSLLSTGITLTAVLIDDSSRAEAIVADWTSNGPSEPSEGMALAPWTLNGSSYIELEGNLFSFLAADHAFASVAVPMADLGFFAKPLYGEWIVFTLDTEPIEGRQVPLEEMASGYVAARIGSKMDVHVVSQAVEDLAGHLEPRDGYYTVTDQADIDREMTVVTYPEGSLSAGEIADLFMMIRPESFFSGIPSELAALAPPRVMIDSQIDLWMYASDAGAVYYQAALARQAGMTFPGEEADLTTTEHLLRVAALQGVMDLDTTDALRFYEENQEYYQLPELRSVLLAYVPDEWMTDVPVASFDDLDRYYSNTDSLDVMMPTPPRPIEIFGPLGEAVFSAEPEVFTGPVDVSGTEMNAYFQVVEVVPPGSASPEEIIPLLLSDCRMSTISSSLDGYIGELQERYEIEIDSSAVARVDPWASVY